MAGVALASDTVVYLLFVLGYAGTAPPSSRPGQPGPGAVNSSSVIDCQAPAGHNLTIVHHHHHHHHRTIVISYE